MILKQLEWHMTGDGQLANTTFSANTPWGVYIVERKGDRWAVRFRPITTQDSGSIELLIDKCLSQPAAVIAAHEHYMERARRMVLT